MPRHPALAMESGANHLQSITLRLLPLDGPEPRRPSCARNSPSLQDRQTEVRDGRAGVVQEVRNVSTLSAVW